MVVFIKKKKIGTWSDISCFSFEEKKIITTGDGGMICLNNKNKYPNFNVFLTTIIVKDENELEERYTAINKNKPVQSIKERKIKTSKQNTTRTRVHLYTGRAPAARPVD